MGFLSKMPSTHRNGWPWDEEVSTQLYSDQKYKWPKISIITPSYNQGQFIEETIRSILAQNYPNLEYIIIDGGSNDGTIDIIKKYEPYISYWVSEKDNGQSDALIKGFNTATGLICNWINSDDILNPNALYHIATTFIHYPDISFVHGKNGIISIDSKPEGYMPHPDNEFEARYLCEMPYGQQACFFKSDIYKKSGGIDIELTFSMDYALYAKMHLLKIKSMQINDLIGSYRVHPETKTTNLENIMRYENGNIFMTVLASVGKKEMVGFFRSLGFESYKNYKVERNIPFSLLRTSILLFLKKNIWYYYNQGNLVIAFRMALKVIKLEPKNILNLHYIKIIKDGIKGYHLNKEKK